MITFDTLIHDVNVWADSRSDESDKSWVEQTEEIGNRLEALEVAINSDKGPTIEEMTAMGDVFIALLVLCQQRGYQADTCLNIAFNKVKNQPKTEKE